ncbi:hypothetical protein BGZ82_000490, partial [Podila clonocystis]
AQRHTDNFLRNLEKLTITMNTGPKAVDDAMVDFGQHLQYLKATGSVSSDGVNQTKVGDWNLPCLKAMGLDLRAESVIYIGQLNSPYLERLSIKMLHRSSRHAMSDSPVAPFNDTNSVYPSPVWKLSHLRSLELYGKPVMLFDFDSLDNMPTLERLVMISGPGYQPTPTCTVPRLAAYRCHKRPLPDVEASSTPDPKVGTKWKDHWDLQRLTYLKLAGPLSSVFFFQWLASCPSLESIHLNICEGFQRLPLLSSSKNTAILSIEAPSETQPDKAGLENVDDSGSDQAMVPLVESKLQKITLQGPWVTSMQDFTKVLSVYAPNLKFLDTVVDVIKMDNSDLAQGVMEGASTSASKTNPGSRLMNVTSDYTMTTKVLAPWECFVRTGGQTRRMA